MSKLSLKVTGFGLFSFAVIGLLTAHRTNADDCKSFDVAVTQPCGTSPLKNCGQNNLIDNGFFAVPRYKCAGAALTKIHNGRFGCAPMPPPFPGFFTKCVDGFNPDGTVWKEICTDTKVCTLNYDPLLDNWYCENSAIVSTSSAQRKMSINCVTISD